MGRNEEANAAYNQAIAWQAQSLAKNPGPYIDLGSLLIDENRPQDAIASLLRAIEIAPRESRAHELLGKAYTRAEDLPKAQVELEKAIELSPQAPNLHCMLAPVYRKQGLSEKAKAEYDLCATLTATHFNAANSMNFFGDLSWIRSSRLENSKPRMFITVLCFFAAAIPSLDFPCRIERP